MGLAALKPPTDFCRRVFAQAGRTIRYTRKGGTGMADGNAALVSIQVELYGLAQMACNRRQVCIDVPYEAAMTDIVTALVHACPALRGPVIRDDLSGLHESYVLNLNGLAFIARDRLQLQPGDTLLLFSSQAGG